MAKEFNPDKDSIFTPYDYLLPMFGNIVKVLNSTPGIPKEYVERAQHEHDALQKELDEAFAKDAIPEANYDLENRVNELVTSFSSDIKQCPKFALYTEYFMLQRIPANRSHPYPDLDYSEEIQNAVRNAIRTAYGRNRDVEVAMRHRFMI